MNIRKLLIGGSVLLGAITASFALTASPAPANAVQCGAAECSIDSTARGESNWRDEISQGSNGNTGGGGSGTPSNPNRRTYYAPCASFIPTGGGTNTNSYPAVNSSSYNCFAGNGGWGGGSGGSTICSPRSDRAANGILKVYVVHPVTQREIAAYWVCLYPTDAYAPIERIVGGGKVYTGGVGNFHSVGSIPEAQNFGNSGLLSSTSGYVNRGVNLSAPEPWIGSWQPSFTAKTAKKSNGDPLYSYYRLSWSLDYRMCNKWAYPSWLGVPARYDCSQQGTDRSAQPWTFACNIGTPPLKAGIIAGASFVPSTCEPRWQCVINEPLRVNGLTDTFTIMRNGDRLPVTLPTVGVSGTGVQKARDWKVKHTLNDGATPSTSLIDQTWKWGQWENYKKDGNTIAFYWASSSATQPFSWRTNYKFTADFYLPTQDSIGGATTYKWVVGGAECPQVKQSPKILVQRAVNR